VDHVPDPMLLRKFGSAGNQTRSSDHYTTSPYLIMTFVVSAAVNTKFTMLWKAAVLCKETQVQRNKLNSM
jgi:hypothetical protein